MHKLKPSKFRGGVIFVSDALPKSPQGKIKRADLRQMYQHHQRFQAKRRNISTDVLTELEKKNSIEAQRIITAFILEVLNILIV